MIAQLQNHNCGCDLHDYGKDLMKIVLPKHTLIVHDKVHACTLVRNRTE
jgi:hypothetical protein